MTDEKDYAAAIEGIEQMDIDKLHELYSQILATAHDVGYEVPDDQLVESDDPDVLRGIIPALHEGLTKFNAGVDLSRGEEDAAGDKPEPASSKRKKPAGGGPVKRKSSRGGEAEAESKTASGPTTQVDEEDNAMTTTAKKAAAPKKAAKKAAPAPKGGKAAKANARTPAAPRASKWSEKATIKVLAKENPTRKGTGRFERVANLLKADGKPVSEYLKKGGRTGTLSYAIEQEWVKVVG